MKFKIICLLFIFNIVILNRAHAFFQYNDRPDNMRIEDTTIDHSTQDNYTFYLYDNFFSRGSENYFIKKKENFIPIDQIRLNIPMTILIQDSIYPENSIDRMMLANLRAKKLSDEYTSLQKKARLILQNYVIPEKKEHQQKSIPVDENINIHEKTEAIKRSMSHLIFLGHISNNDELERNPMIFEHQSPINGDINIPGKNTSHISLSDNIENKGRNTDISQAGFSRKESSDLSWNVNALLKFIGYIVNNRLEIMLYMIFIIMIILLISLKLKK